MRLLLDTHAFIWFAEGNDRLSERARHLIAEPTNDIFLSVASVWEMAIKVSLGKLEIEKPLEEFFEAQLTQNSIALLGISQRHAIFVAELPLHHRDPFDRMIISQSIVEEIPLVSIDGVFDSYGINRVW